MAAHLVIPGQVIATSSTNNEGGDADDSGNTSFLRGHGTFVEHNPSKQQDQLVASVCGTVQRVNQLITVIPFGEALYQGHVGDLVVGQITSVGTNRWTVQLLPQLRDASLPLSGVHLPGGAQRVRTAQDQLNMARFLQVGDWVCAEVHKVQPVDGSLSLHTRSFRYTKLENGCWVRVPPALIPRRKNHHTTLLDDTLDVLWGTNGVIWIQRSMKEQEHDGQRRSTAAEDNNTNNNNISKDLMADLQEQIRRDHATTPVPPETRRSIARVRNSIECLRLVHAMVTPERVEAIYRASLELNLTPSQLLWPDHTIRLTQEIRG